MPRTHIPHPQHKHRGITLYRHRRDYRRQLGKPQPRTEPSPQWQHGYRLILDNPQRATGNQGICQPSPQTPTQRTNQYQLYRETSNITQRQARQTLHLPQPTEETLTMLKSTPFYFFKISSIHAFIASYTHPKLILCRRVYWTCGNFITGFTS